MRELSPQAHNAKDPPIEIINNKKTDSPQIEDSLRYLKSFLSVAKTGSIAKSAEVVFKAPSAITRDMSELERILGVSLFERRPRGMLLNVYGEAVLRRASRIHEEIRMAADEFYQKEQFDGGQDRNSVANLLFSGRKLQLLVGLAEQKQASAVGRRLGLSQAGVSMSLSRLEEALRQPLFQRMAQGMVPTDPASRLLLRAKRILADLRHMLSDISAIEGTLLGTVTIGALPLGRTLILPSAIAATLAAYPEIRIKTFESPYDVLVTGLRNGDIDFIFGALRPHDLCQGLRNEPLFIDQVAIIGRASHPLSRQPTLSLADLTNERWILPRQESPARQLLETSFRNAGLEPPCPSVETGDLGILRTLLQNSDILTAISPHQLCFEIGEGSLTELPVRLEGTRRDIGITLREGALLSPAVQAILTEIRLLVRDHLGLPPPGG